MDTKKIGIIGTGAVGKILAAHLGEKGGHRVYVVDIDENIIKAISEGGIGVSGIRSFEARVEKAFRSIDKLHTVNPDYVFVCVKTTALEAVAARLESLNPEITVLISFQNGIDTDRILAQNYPEERVFRGVVNYAGNVLTPRKVKMTFFHPPNCFGHSFSSEDSSGGIEKETSRIAELLTESDLESEASDFIEKPVWRKAILNSCLIPTSVMTGLTMSKIMNKDETRNLVATQLREFLDVAESEGITFEDDFEQEAMEYLSSAGDHKPSMLVDFEEGRKLELEFLNGRIQRYAEENGVSCPTNDVMIKLIQGLLLKRRLSNSD